MAGQQQEGLDLRLWARLVWRRKWILLALVVLLPAAVYFASSSLPKTYESSATINVKSTAEPSAFFSNGISFGSDIFAAQTLIRTNVVGRRAARILGRGPSAAPGLVSQISVSPTNPEEETGQFLTITAQASNPVTAARVANAFAKAVSRARTETAIRGIDQTIATLKAQESEADDQASRDALAEQLQQLRGMKAGQQETTSLVEAALPNDTPVSPKPRRNTVIAFILALLIAAALAPLLDRMDRRIREPKELEDMLAQPLLATVPDDAFPGHPPGHHVKEAFQTLRASLTYFNVDRPLSTVVVASAAQQDGKTTVAINLAIAYALDEKDVILVDADLRRPQVADRLGKEAKVGLDAVLVGESTVDEALIDVDAGAGRLRILPGTTPPPNPAVLLGSNRMQSLIAELTEQADIVVIDTPAVLAVSDAIPIINRAAGTLLVARMDKTTKDAIERTNQVVTSAGGTVIGSVATGAHAGSGYGYYADGYYGYDGRDQEKKKNGAGDPANGAGKLRGLMPGGKDSSN